MCVCSQRLRIGSGKDDGGRPTSLLTHADVVTALHRCKYDPASAEASLVGLQRRRETKHKSASVSSDARKLQHSSGDVAAEVATAPEDSTTAQNSSNQLSSFAPGGEPYAGKSDVGGNRWEDWSEADRAAFLLHLGDKVDFPKTCLNLSRSFYAKLLWCGTVLVDGCVPMSKF